MSNDLIDRNAFEREISEYMKNVYECDIESVSDFQDCNKSKESYIVQGLFEAFELIGNVPTAYGVGVLVPIPENVGNTNAERYADVDTVNAIRKIAQELDLACSDIVESGKCGDEMCSAFAERIRSWCETGEKIDNLAEVAHV